MSKYYFLLYLQYFPSARITCASFLVEGRGIESTGRSFGCCLKKTRMHSNRMRIVRCSGHLGGVGVCPGGGGSTKWEDCLVGCLLGGVSA